MTVPFPRGSKVPTQSPLFWVTHKDRYLRQLLIQDIERDTKRELLVYFTDVDNTDAVIDPGDDQFFYELLQGLGRRPVDLILETNGGFTDPTEKICSLLRTLAPDLRVIVPRRAKSNGTVIALAGRSIVMSAGSELGPIDPFVQGIPAEFVIKQPAAYPPPLVSFAISASQQTQMLATTLLQTGMLAGKKPAEIAAIVGKLATRDHYASHGSVIDVHEAIQLGLVVEELPVEDEIWQKLWLLRTMYAYDCPRSGYAKIFESTTKSAAVSVKPTKP